MYRLPPARHNPYLAYPHARNPYLAGAGVGTAVSPVTPPIGPWGPDSGSKCVRMVCTVDSLTHQMNCHDFYYMC